MKCKKQWKEKFDKAKANMQRSSICAMQIRNVLHSRTATVASKYSLCRANRMTLDGPEVQDECR